MSKSLYLGEGESGCVLSPHIQCEVIVPKTVKTVGKIFSKKPEFNEEIEIVNHIKRVDHQNKWTVKYYGHCDVSKEDVLRNVRDVFTEDNDVEHVCFRKVNSRSSRPYLYQIIYAYGGIPASQACATYPVDTLVDGLHDLFEGLFIFALNGVFLNDIKEDNIAYNRKSNKFLFIDLGSTTFIDLNDEQNSVNAYFSTVRNFMSLCNTMERLTHTATNIESFKKFILRIKDKCKIRSDNDNDIYVLLDMLEQTIEKY